MVGRAQLLYSFEGSLEGWEPQGGSAASVSLDTVGATKGSNSMRVDWPGSFSWVRTLNTQGGHEEILRDSNNNTVLLDVTSLVPGYWKQSATSLNDSINGWQQSPEFPIPYDLNGAGTIAIKLAGVANPLATYLDFNLSFNGDPSTTRTLYIDNMRAEKSNLLFDFEDSGDPLEAFAAQNPLDVSLSSDTQGATKGSKSMKVSWFGGFQWIGSTKAGILDPMRASGNKTVIMDINVPEGYPGAWANITMSVNSPDGWSQSAYTADIPVFNPGQKTVVLKFNDTTLPSGTPGFFQVNFAVNGPATFDPCELYVDNIRVEAATNPISGQVTLGDWGGAVAGRQVNLRLKDAGGNEEQVLCTLDASGNFSTETSLSGAITARFRDSHWLAKTVSATVGGSPIVATLINGDVDGDNSITIFDYIELSGSFDLSVGDVGYLANADLDGDGSVTIFDYIILSNNFDVTGDEL